MGSCVIVGCCGWCGVAQYCGDGCGADDGSDLVFCIHRNMYLFADTPACEIGWDEEEGIIEGGNYLPH